ncbi:MAG: hypothetical protein HYS59_01485 [Candidatus Vogelbacteria bacterium]|nr:hypothetical protein [Candidatus Vogelbacteria bacterium]
MPKKPETFGGFSPEPGSKDEETRQVESLEEWQKYCEEMSEARGEPKEEDWDRIMQDEMESEARDVEVYIRRARLAGDTRTIREIIDDKDELEIKLNAYTEQRKKDGTYTNPWNILVDFMKENVSSYAAYLQKRQEEDAEADPWNIYLEWKVGKDLKDK